MNSDDIERAAIAHCQRAIFLGLHCTQWEQLSDTGRSDALSCMRAALFAYMHPKSNASATADSPKGASTP
jgi:hypothetical protein